MKTSRIFEWLILAATAGLMVVLKETHFGVIHFKYFLLILLVWSLIVIVLFRALSDAPRPDNRS